MPWRNARDVRLGAWDRRSPTSDSLLALRAAANLSLEQARDQLIPGQSMVQSHVIENGSKRSNTQGGMLGYRDVMFATNKRRQPNVAPRLPRSLVSDRS